jgi:hypothetical protein
MKPIITFIGIVAILIFAGCSKSRAPSSSTSDAYKPPTLNAQRVPDNLRDLLPLAAKWGIDDDDSRSNKIASATEEDKQELQQALKGRTQTINRWFHTFPSDTATKQGMSTEARAYFSMMICADALGLKIQ